LISAKLCFYLLNQSDGAGDNAIGSSLNDQTAITLYVQRVQFFQYTSGLFLHVHGPLDYLAISARQ
jgi:hypothetical protein